MSTNTLYQTKISIQYGSLKETIEWCDKYCTDEWFYIIIDSAGADPGTYSFQFKSEKDFMTFLFWKT